ncbi:hypothetical protein PY650_34375 [Rhizobium calliandrae]|uniref:Uncharacterized protein n=1 Tax=Rhizobium calliandrae TaxID=1312182 RepID=A0ABT7KPM8_9HYPH|nr:hypothetical protein [Rhizobium calliandrae]MDL2410577.1 hypothetical protein [Rhizobium calliandrae]
MAGKVISIGSGQPKKLSRQQFMEQTLALVDAGCVKVSVHLSGDHPERKISQAQIEMCLIKGTVQSDPVINMFGNWQSEIFRHMDGWQQQVVVVTAI